MTAAETGGGDQQREAAGDEEDDPETLEAERAKEFGENFQSFAHGYI